MTQPWKHSSVQKQSIFIDFFQCDRRMFNFQSHVETNHLSYYAYVLLAQQVLYVKSIIIEIFRNNWCTIRDDDNMIGSLIFYTLHKMFNNAFVKKLKTCCYSNFIMALWGWIKAHIMMDYDGQIIMIEVRGTIWMGVNDNYLN